MRSKMPLRTSRITSPFFSERELVRKVAEQAQGKGIGAADVLAVSREYLSENAVHLRNGDQLLFTTPEMLELEKEMLSNVEKSREGTWHGVQREGGGEDSRRELTPSPRAKGSNRTHHPKKGDDCSSFRHGWHRQNNHAQSGR